MAKDKSFQDDKESAMIPWGSVARREAKENGYPMPKGAGVRVALPLTRSNASKSQD